MKQNAEVVELALTWFDENNPFDHDRDKKLLVSFSTGFTSTTSDAVNAERAVEIGRQMQMKLDETMQMNQNIFIRVTKIAPERGRVNCTSRSSALKELGFPTIELCFLFSWFWRFVNMFLFLSLETSYRKWAQYYTQRQASRSFLSFIKGGAKTPDTANPRNNKHKT